MNLAAKHNRRIRWQHAGDDRPQALKVKGDPGQKLRPYAETHLKIKEIEALYGVPGHKLADLLPPPDVVSTCYRRTRLWSRTVVLATLGAPS